MTEQTVEVFFCDLCGTSVPLADLERGVALRRQDKTIGACCRSMLDPAPMASPAAVVAPGGGENRLLPVAIVLLAALAAVAIFLDQRIGSFEQAWRVAQEESRTRQQSDSEVLMGVDVELDKLAPRTELEAAVAALADLRSAFDTTQAALQQRVESLQAEVASMREAARDPANRAVDYRPLFDDLRQRHQRVLELLESLRAAPGAPSLTPPAPGVPAPAVAEDATGLPANLAAAAAKLGSNDPAVRFEAVDALVQSKNPEVLAHILPLARDPDEFVRRLTVEGLRDFKQAPAVEALLAALLDSKENVADTAWRSLKELTGQSIPFDSAASNDVRTRAAQRWSEWWDKNKATFGK